VNTPRHDGFDERATVFVFHPSFSFKITGSIRPKGHGLILKIALSPLVTNGTIQRVVEEKEFQNPFSCFFHQGRGGENLHPFHGGHGTGSYGLRGFEDFHQTHSTVSSNGKTLVVTKSRGFHSYRLTGLKDRGPSFNKNFYPINMNFEEHLLSKGLFAVSSRRQPIQRSETPVERSADALPCTGVA
jgi:hypothetical protein